jgi:hypothetical protein
MAHSEEHRVRRFLELQESFQVAFVAAAVERVVLKMNERLKGRGFDQVAGSAIEDLWASIEGKLIETDSLEASEGECVNWAPDTEGEPESEDVMYVLIAVAYSCRLARRVEVEECVRGVVRNCELAVSCHQSQDSVIGGSTQNSKVIEEVSYQTRLLDVLAAPNMEKIDRKFLLGL